MTPGLERSLVRHDASLRAALESLDRSGFGVALVVDDDGRLGGLFTDGDVRRAIIGGTDLDTSPLSDLLAGRGRTGTRSPVVVGPTASSADARDVMERTGVRHVPVVDDQHRPIGLHLWSDRSTPDDAARTPLPHRVLVMAGGRGERLRPLTDATPKPMLHVQGRPLLEGILVQLAHAGLRDVTIAVHHRAERIVDYFGDGATLGLDIRYLHEDAPLGTGGALRLLADELTEPVMIVNGDILTWLDFGKVVRFHDDHFGEARHDACTVAIRRHTTTIPFGVVDIDGSRVLSIVEKPTHSVFVNAGVYVVGPAIARQIDETPCDMPTVLQDHLDRGGEVAAFPITEPWLDIGTPDQYAHAQTVIPKGYPDVH